MNAMPHFLAYDPSVHIPLSGQWKKCTCVNQLIMLYFNWIRLRDSQILDKLLVLDIFRRVFLIEMNIGSNLLVRSVFINVYRDHSLA